MNGIADRLSRQMAFIEELEKLKLVDRRNRTIDGSRRENSAEHSWHVALMALVLLEHAESSPIDPLRVVQMLLLHDVIEIYAGDTWLYDEEAVGTQAHRETESARQLFSLLPSDQADAFRAVWEEFESGASPEARFAAAIDALQPLSNHLAAGDPDASESRPSAAEVLARKRQIGHASSTLWRLAQTIIEESANRGLYVK